MRGEDGGFGRTAEEDESEEIRPQRLHWDKRHEAADETDKAQAKGRRHGERAKRNGNSKQKRGKKREKDRNETHDTKQENR